MSKLNWERVAVENRIAKNGSITLKSTGRPAGEKRAKPKCIFCRKPLSSAGPVTLQNHLRKCDAYHKEKIRKRKLRRSWRSTNGKSFSHFSSNKDFPNSLIGKLIRTSTFVGKGVELLEGGLLIRLETNDGRSKIYNIASQIKAEKQREKS